MPIFRVVKGIQVKGLKNVYKKNAKIDLFLVLIAENKENLEAIQNVRLATQERSTGYGLVKALRKSLPKH